MAIRRQFSLQAILLTVSYFALAFAWLSTCVLRYPSATFRPGPLCLLSAVVALAAWRRMRCGAGTNGFYLLVLATYLAGVGLVGQIIAVLQTISQEGQLDWEWFRTQIGATVVANLVWPLLTLLPASVSYLNRKRDRQMTSGKWLQMSLVLGVASVTAAIVAVAILFHSSCARF